MRAWWIPFSLAIALIAAGASAQEIQDEKVDMALTGKITVVDAIAHTVALEGANGERTVVGVGDKTTIMSGAKKMGLSDLHKGAWVAVDADRHGDRVVATSIEVVDDPTGAGPPP